MLGYTWDKSLINVFAIFISLKLFLASTTTTITSSNMQVKIALPRLAQFNSYGLSYIPDNIHSDYSFFIHLVC